MRELFKFSITVTALLFSGCEIEDRLPAEMVSIEKAQPIGGEESLDAEIKFDIGSLEISGDAARNVYSLNLDYDRARFEPDIRYDAPDGSEGVLKVALESTRKLSLRNEVKKNRLHLNLTDSLPVRLQVNTGVGESRLSLSGIRLARLDIGAGVGGTRISSYEPNPVVCERIQMENGVGSLEAVGLGNLNFRRFEFEGGVGGAELDFSGEWQEDADVRIEVGIGGVTMRMPRSVGVRVDAEKNFLSGVHLEGFQKRGSEYYSENYDNARIRVTVRVTTGIGGFKFTWL